MKKVLVACEESQTVTKAFRERGFDAYSCDIQPCSGGHKEWHILGDVLEVLARGGRLENGMPFPRTQFDLMIAHPPCTYLSSVATRWHSLRCASLESINDRTIKRIDGMRFFMEMVFAPAEHIAIENPVGVMNTAYRKPDQIIEPYEFAKGGAQNKAEFVTKKTCLWLKNLPPLFDRGWQEAVWRPDNRKIFGVMPSGKARTWEDSIHGQKKRSKTFSGIAEAMAEQWGNFIMGE